MERKTLTLAQLRMGATSISEPSKAAGIIVNPSNDQATFVQSTRMQRLKKTSPVMFVFIGNLSLSTLR